MSRRLLLLAVLATLGCRVSDRKYLDRVDRARQREAEYDAAGVGPHFADRDVDRALQQQQDNRK